MQLPSRIFNLKHLLKGKKSLNLQSLEILTKTSLRLLSLIFFFQLRSIDCDNTTSLLLRKQPLTFNLGEGLDYSVDVCKTDNGGQVMAKHVKVASSLQRSDGSFVSPGSRRIRKVLQELRVCCHPPLKRSKNILAIMGYSWEYAQGSTTTPCGIIEYAALGTLRQFLTSSGRRSLIEKKELCIGVARGLLALPSCGIIHGDVKMENILVVQKPEGQIVAKLADFWELDHQTCQYTRRKYWGTTMYNAPEVRLFEDSQSGAPIPATLLATCDVFSLWTTALGSGAGWIILLKQGRSSIGPKKGFRRYVASMSAQP